MTVRAIYSSYNGTRATGLATLVFNGWHQIPVLYVVNHILPLFFLRSFLPLVLMALFFWLLISFNETIDNASVCKGFTTEGNGEFCFRVCNYEIKKVSWKVVDH